MSCQSLCQLLADSRSECHVSHCVSYWLIARVSCQLLVDSLSVMSVNSMSVTVSYWLTAGVSVMSVTVSVTG